MGFYNSVPEEDVFRDKIFKWIVDIVLMLVLVTFFVVYYGNQLEVDGNSMKSTLENGDTVMVNTIRYRAFSPKRYDVALIQKQDSYGNSVSYIKRVVGLPGETVEIKQGRIYIDGEKLDFNDDKENIINAGIAASGLKLGKDEYFVIGDNWNNSEDSRSDSVGVIKRDEFAGKVWAVSWPFADITLVR